MADTAVVRNRRSRKHKRGDHSECIPGRCESVTPQASEPVTSPVTEAPRLGEAGSALWRDMTAAGPLPPMQRVLLLEACRIADRLDKLDRKLSGEDREWLRFNPDDLEDAEVTVIVDKALSEARQQAVALKTIVAELRQAGAKKPGRAAPSREPQQGEPKPGGGGGISDLTARIARRDQTAG